MPIDVILIRACLLALFNNASRGGCTEELVGMDVEAALRRPYTAQQIRAALSECKARGWAVEEADTWGQPAWSITQAGMDARKDL